MVKYLNKLYKNYNFIYKVILLFLSVYLIVSMFPMLAPAELKEAFKLATAGKLKDINITTYYGKFTVQILGDILKAYLKLRNKALSKYENQLQIEQSKC